MSLCETKSVMLTLSRMYPNTPESIFRNRIQGANSQIGRGGQGVLNQT